MKKLCLFTSLALLSISWNSCSTSKGTSTSNMVATLQIDEPIDGVCNNDRIIAILPFPGNGQEKAKPILTNKEVEVLLADQVIFLNENAGYEDKGMVGLIVNCNGELVRCQMSNRTKSEELDAQIVAVFSTLKDWKPGSINGKKVDTSVLYSFTITDGKIIL